MPSNRTTMSASPEPEPEPQGHSAREFWLDDSEVLPHFVLHGKPRAEAWTARGRLLGLIEQLDEMLDEAQAEVTNLELQHGVVPRIYASDLFRQIETDQIDAQIAQDILEGLDKAFEDVNPVAASFYLNQMYAVCSALNALKGVHLSPKQIDQLAEAVSSVPSLQRGTNRRVISCMSKCMEDIARTIKPHESWITRRDLILAVFGAIVIEIIKEAKALTEHLVEQQVSASEEEHAQQD